MGRQQYLTRLALGRSAFQDVEDADATAAKGHHVACAGTGEDETCVQQQYDSKGRPMNPAAEARDAEMRRAQNSILALVGIVEDRDRAQESSEREARRMRDERKGLLEREHSFGEDLDLARDFVEAILTWFPGCLTRKIQIGLYDARQPFFDILKSEWRTVTAGGVRNLYATLFSGSLGWLLYSFVRIGYATGVEWIMERISEYLWAKNRRLRTQKRTQQIMEGVAAGLVICGDALLLPLNYYATAQALSIAPSWPLLPPAKLFMPWNTLSLHHFGWKPMIHLPVLRSISSPASLLLAHCVLFREASNDTSLFTGVNEASIIMDKPNPTRDPIGWILYQAHDVRTTVMEWCGWKVVSLDRTSPDVQHENDVLLEVGEKGFAVFSTHRSTQLAHLPAQQLSEAVDNLLLRLMMLPFESLVLRAIAGSYLASPLPKSSCGLQVTSLYTPFSGTLHSVSTSPWAGGIELANFAGYMSKIGLSMALHSAVHIAVFAGLYGVVRWKGVRRFRWGKLDESKKNEQR